MTYQYPPETILKLLPHRYPFLFIDGILEHKFEEIAKCCKGISYSEEVLQGHFPGNPIYPGVLLIEMGLQTTQILLTDVEKVLANKESNGSPAQGFFLSCDKFKFMKKVLPGDQLVIQSTINLKAMGMVKAEILILNQSGEEVAKGQVSVSS